MRVGYLGPEGTVSHEAVLPLVGAGDELVALATNHDVVQAVQDGRVDRAFAPIENSLEGGINATLDALAFDAAGVRIVGEHVHAVHHCLLARPGTGLGEVVEVRSHPQPLAQCAAWLRTHLPAARPVAVASTAAAVQDAVAASGVAALGTRTAGARYGAAVLAADVEDAASNRTRFVWLAPADDAGAGGDAGGAADAGGDPDVDRKPGADIGVNVGTGTGTGTGSKTSVVFHGAGDLTPGWLVRCLDEFASRGVNLSRIESRPLRSQLGHYLFHVDLEGAVGTGVVDDALAALAGHCEDVRVLGSYPAG